MDSGVMRSRLVSLLQDASWADGVSKQDIVNMVQRDDALHTLIEEYLPEERFTALDDVLTRIPVQAWQDVQGDDWRGAESEEAGASASHFREGAAARDE
jgi:hypothetical protein